MCLARMLSFMGASFVGSPLAAHKATKGVLSSMQPPLGYVAPELANADGANAAASISTAADVFSLGAP